jgi:hypothetical protein
MFSADTLPADGLASAPGASPAFAAWLQPRRRFYLWVFAVSALLALALPLATHWLDVAGTTDWYEASLFSWARDHLGLQWWMTIWLASIGWVAILAGLVLGFEAMAWRWDPGDVAWTSMTWTLRGWVPALVWCPLSLLAASLDDKLGSLASVPGFAFAIATTLLVGTAVNLAGRRVPRRWKIRSPGPLNLLLVLLFLPALLIPDRLGMADDWWTPTRTAFAIAAVVVLWLPTQILGLFFALLWLNRARNGARLEWRRAWTPAVFLPSIASLVRLWAWGPLLLLALFPLGYWLIDVVPTYEDAMVPCGCHGSWLIQASRLSVKWWWLVLLAVGGAYSSLPWGWWQQLAQGRLLVELGLVRSDVILPPGSNSP